MYRMAPRWFALSLVALGLVAPAASADTGGSNFSIDPNPANPGEPVTFEFEPGSGINSPNVVWDLDGDDVYETIGTPDAERVYNTPGSVTVRMRVTDADPGSVTVEKLLTVNAPPVASFDFNPTSPLPGQEVLFAAAVSDPDGDDFELEWAFGDGRTSTSQAPRISYSTPGTRTVTLTATDDDGGETVVSRDITVRDPSGPAAAFSYLPVVPLVGQGVLFVNQSTASSGSIVSSVWDLDDDGAFDDSPAGWSFSRPGLHEVQLRVTQSNGNSAVVERRLRVNAPPVAAFTWSPFAIASGGEVDLISTSRDVEGAVATAWDLDGDGQYDDAAGAWVSRRFSRAGTYEVGLRVTDSDGVARTSRRRLSVGSASLAPRFITPVPVVRLGGKVLARAARVQILTVRAPRGALIRVKCTGDACPTKVVRRRSRGRAVRFKRFERTLAAGTRLGIYVRQPGVVGKYTRFTIRAGAAPKRLDRCLMPGRSQPVRCP